MGKTYFNDALVGNSKMLGCLTKNGELIRLFWPNIDYSQHVDMLHIGILMPLMSKNTYWLHDDMWEHNQEYIEKTNVIVTISQNTSLGFRIKQTDFILNNEDVLVRNYIIENIGEEVNTAALVLYSSMLSNPSNLRSTLFDFDTDSIVHYSHDNYIAISADTEANGFQIGDALEAAQKGELLGIDEIGMSSNAAAIWNLGEFFPGQSKEITLYLYAAKTLKDSIVGIKAIKEIPINGLINTTIEYWRNFLGNTKKINITDKQIINIYNRTLLTFPLMSDTKNGGLLASPEVDEDFTRCGRYAYCWGRDAAFITTALDKCELVDISDKFYSWCFLNQAENGSWYQRYYLDGNLAPSWGFQVDETGAILWGIWQHYEVTKKIEFLETAWEYVRKAADFLVDFIDNDTGLPKPSYDLWEERFGEHSYSTAAVYGGLDAASKISDLLGKSITYGSKWVEMARNIKTAIEKKFWDEEAGRFLRSVKVKLHHWDKNDISSSIEEVEINKKGYKRYVALKDLTIDASLVGLTVPFNVFPADHQYMLKTINAIEEHLKSPEVGGIKRYENDGYIGGNPWIITTLWLALYYVKLRNYDRAKEYFNWAVEHCTELGFLPEQVDKLTGRAAWVIPLTWSHAMFILVLFELMEQGCI